MIYFWKLVSSVSSCLPLWLCVSLCFSAVALAFHDSFRALNISLLDICDLNIEELPSFRKKIEGRATFRSSHKLPVKVTKEKHTVKTEATCRLQRSNSADQFSFLLFFWLLFSSKLKPSCWALQSLYTCLTFLHSHTHACAHTYTHAHMHTCTHFMLLNESVDSSLCLC